MIGTDTRGIEDLVRGGAGWIAASDDAAGLASALDEAASNRAEARERGAVGRERAVTEYALTRIIGRYEELYEEALAQNL